MHNLSHPVSDELAQPPIEREGRVSVAGPKFGLASPRRDLIETIHAGAVVIQDVSHHRSGAFGRVFTQATLTKERYFAPHTWSLRADELQTFRNLNASATLLAYSVVPPFGTRLDEITLPLHCRELLQLGAPQGCVVKEVRRDTIGQELQYNLQHPNMERGERVLQDLDMTVTDATEKRKILLDIAAGLRYLGQQGVMHRDLKPANVVCVGGTWKIIDFGLARRHMRHRLNEDGQVAVDDLAAGTREFTDPVCYDPHRASAYVGLPRELQAQVDVYSLGRIMRWMFPTDPEVVSIEYDCTRCELFRRCKIDEFINYVLSLDGRRTTTGCLIHTLAPPERFDDVSMIGYPRLPQPGEFLQFRYLAWRDEGEKRIAELRLRLMHYYNLLNANHISYSNPAVPFKNLFQEPALEFNDDTNPVEHFPTVRNAFGDPRIARAKVILLSGPAGSGKSVLCRHILREQISFGPRPSVTFYVSLPELVREADTRVGLEPLKLVEWCLRHTDNDRFRLDFMDLLQEVNGWWYNVTWILDTRDSTTGRRRPLSDFAPITFQSLMKWMWCAIIVCRSGETLPDLDDKAVALRVRPWTDDTCDRYLDALQELAPTSRRVRMSSTFVKAFFTRTPALTMTPLLLDLIAFANINGSGNGPPSLVALVQSAYEQILLRDQADDVTETNFGHHVAAAFARVFGGTPLPPCDTVSRTLTEVLAAIHVGSLEDEEVVKRVVFRVLTEAAVVDEVVFFTALGEALVERSETAEMLARQLLHAVPNCIGFASACVVALATANTAARAVLVSTAYSLAAVWFKGLESACATQNSATLLQTLHEQFPSHVTLHVAVSCAHPSRAADVVEYCARHGVHPELWQCMIQLPDHEVRNHLALRRLTTSNYRDIWKAAVLITKRSRYARIPASTAAWLLEAAKLYSMNVNFVEAWLRALEARQGAVYYIGVVAIEEVQRHSNPTSEFLAAEATPKPRLELHPSYLCMLIDYRATLRVAGLTPVSARGASSVLYYDDASHLHDHDSSTCQRDDFDLD